MRSFKKILKSIGCFLLVTALLSVLLAEFYLRGENFNIQDWKEREELAGTIDLINCGASYTLFGVQPRILDQELGVNSYNLSSTHLSLLGRYTLLREELARNPVELVVLEVSVDTLIQPRSEAGPEGDLTVMGKLSGPGERFRFFLQAFQVSEYPVVYYQLVSRGIEAGLNLLGGHYKTTNDTLSKGYRAQWEYYIDPVDDYRALYHTESLPEQIPQENVVLLEQVVSLCQEHGVQVILISTPKSQLYNIRYSNLDYFDAWYRQFAEEHGLIYLNFNLAKSKHVQLQDTVHFFDETHLNSAGAAIFSYMLAGRIEDIRNGTDYSDYFCSSYEELTELDGYFGN